MAFIFDAGKEIARRDKVELPNYGVFDDKRHFVPGDLPRPVNLRGMRIIPISVENIWTSDVETLSETSAEILLSVNASAFEVLKRRLHILCGLSFNGKSKAIYLCKYGWWAG